MGGTNRWAAYPWLKNPWSQHRQSVWRERALEQKPKPKLDPETGEMGKVPPHPAYPVWMRVGMLALGAHRKSGKVDLKSGELAGWLGVSEKHLRNEIAKAKTFGWLDRASDAECLIVPSHAVGGGL